MQLYCILALMLFTSSFFKTLSETQIETLIAGKEIGKIALKNPKTEKEFKTKLKLDKDYKIKFVFDKV